MNLTEQIEWVTNQLNYSQMLEDGDAAKWLSVLNSLTELKNLKEV